jgi:nucleotide-binding universal stress UspA family protein
LTAQTMKIQPPTETGRLVAELEQKDEASLDQAAVLNRAPGGLPSLKRILVPVDFSHCSKEALKFAAPFARQFGAGLTVLHVVAPFYPIDPYGVNLPDYFGPDLMSQAEKLLDCLVREAVPPEVASQNLTRHGQPAHEIIQASRELGADLIIIPTHGHTGLKHVVFGSTAEYVVRHATCPVLTLRVKASQRNE